jgi:hypothetical protein
MSDEPRVRPMPMQRLINSALRGLLLALFVVILMIGWSYCAFGRDRVNQEWGRRAVDFLRYAVVFTIAELVRGSQARRWRGRSH